HHLLDNVGGVTTGHDELTVRHIDHAHLTEGQRETQRGEQQDRPEAQPGEELAYNDFHRISVSSCRWRGVVRGPLMGPGGGGRRRRRVRLAARTRPRTVVVRNLPAAVGIRRGQVAYFRPSAQG